MSRVRLLTGFVGVGCSCRLAALPATKFTTDILAFKQAFLHHHGNTMELLHKDFQRIFSDHLTCNVSVFICCSELHLYSNSIFRLRQDEFPVEANLENYVTHNKYSELERVDRFITYSTFVASVTLNVINCKLLWNFLL